MMPVRVLVAILLLLSIATPALADWLDDYEAGVKAAQNSQWQVVVQKMTSAIKSKPQENARQRTTGTGFVAYHPYYYRGLAHFELGNLDEAVQDLKKATGQGSVKLGAPESILSRAEMQLARQREPEPPPTATVAQQPPAQTTPPVTTPPAQPAVDPNLAPARDRARQTLSRAGSAMQQAQNARAASQPEFSEAQRLLLEAQQQAAAADTTRDWTNVARAADRAISQFDLARTKAQIAQQPAAKEPPASKVARSATEDAIAPKRQQVRAAVEAYFSGDFARSIQAFERLTSEDSDNGLLWAFLGASHYYNWYLGGQANPREEEAAMNAFRKAKQNGNGNLDSRYFPKRVQDFFATVRVR